MRRAVFLSPVAMGCIFLGTATAGPAALAGEVSSYIREPVYDQSVHDDEALVNVVLANNQWPDCTTLESTIRDIFRIEGVQEKSDQEKALALWKWFRILVSATGGSYAYEGPKGRERLCHDPHKILTVYGHHQCDGMSWSMVALWRAAGYMAFDECTWGHTTAALRYRDDDGQVRYHSFDPQRRYYHWDERARRVGTRTLPVMRGMVYRHLTAPVQLHSLRTSLRPGETIDRRWDNQGHVVPSGKDKPEAETRSYYAYTPGKTSGIYAAVGEQVQTFVPEMRPGTFKQSLFDGSRNVACSLPEPGRATLHPQHAGTTAEFIYRLAPPYVIADAECEATLLKSDASDVCRLLLSADGLHWQPICEKERLGQEKVAVNFGKQAWKLDRPNVYTGYDGFIKAELRTEGDVRQVGVVDLKLVVHRMLNKRTLPHLRPGENVLKVTADRLAPGWALQWTIDFRVLGQPRREQGVTGELPCYFEIELPGLEETIHDNYDQHFNDGPLQMSSIRMELVPASADANRTSPSLPEAEALRKFAMSCPHPADMTHKRETERSENDLRETSGFFPQSDVVREDDAAMNELLRQLNTGTAEQRWLAAEELGNYPKALDALVEALCGADIDQTLFLCKALAQIGDRRAVGPLLEKWERAPRGAPGTRYIPDALAAIGDRSVVPHLIAPLERCRFDYRFHIAHALGVLGGREAEKTLRDMAVHDPFPAVRKEAEKGLEALRRKGAPWPVGPDAGRAGFDAGALRPEPLQPDGTENPVTMEVFHFAKLGLEKPVTTVTMNVRTCGT